MSYKAYGFTIVELMIVIIVIGILASISVVAYNGTQDRARFVAAESGLSDINDAIILYYAHNGVYPNDGSGIQKVFKGSSGVVVPGLTSTYIDPFPSITVTSRGDYWEYIVNATATEYKVLRMVDATKTLPAVETTSPRLDLIKSTRAWGYWTVGAKNYQEP